MTTLEHIGIAVRDPDAVASTIESLMGLRRYKSETVEREGVRTHFIGAGSTKLELLEALGPDSPVARFLEKRGEGVHHLAFEVDDVMKIIARGREMGLSPLSIEARPGADRKRIAFFHPKDTHGLLIEVCESVRADTDDPMDDASMTAFGLPRSPAVVIVCLDGSENAALWLEIAGILEPDVYVIVVQAEESRASDLVDGIIGFDHTLHLVVEAGGRAWAERTAADRGEGVASNFVVDLGTDTASISVTFESEVQQTFVIPPVDPRSRPSIRLLAQLLLRLLAGTGSRTDSG
jgi:methylmalonyl-CoA epimerase